MVVRHLDIAIPPGRKTDPANFPGSFLSALYPPLAPRAYKVAGLPIYQRQDLTGPIAAYLTNGETILIDATYPNGAGHDALGRGFVALAGLEAV